MLFALAPRSLSLFSSIVSVMSLRARPNDEALVIRRVTPLVVMVQRYSAWVCADTITLIDGSRRAAIAAMSLPARLPAHPLSVAAPAWKPPWWMTRIGIFTPLSASSATALFAASASSWNVSPATPVGVTIVGVDCSTSPMKPTLYFRLPSVELNCLIP